MISIGKNTHSRYSPLTQLCVPAMRVGVIIIVLDSRRIARLQVGQAGRLDIHKALIRTG